MNNSVPMIPTPRNEAVLSYAPGSVEREELNAEIKRMSGEELEIPCIIGGKRITTGRLEAVTVPHKKDHVIARYHVAGKDEVEQAIKTSSEAKREWENMPWQARCAITLRAAELLQGKYRQILNASTMLGQSKTCHQAEIDASCELIDFWRFNAAFAKDLYQTQPQSSPGIWNMSQLRALEGFVLAITPFNFTSIAANLCTAPAMMGNTVLWKPAETQMLSAYYTYLLFEEAGFPPGVINMLPGFGHELAPMILKNPGLAGIHFTGSTGVFRSLWKQVGEQIDNYRTYPRLIGETGGKDFIVAHPSADDDALITAIVRGGYEFQGQKCSAASRVYVAKSTWGRIKDKLITTINELQMGDVCDYRTYVGAVIKEAAFQRHSQAIEEAKVTSGVTVAAGGECDSSVGWFVRPTLLVVDDPKYKTMEEELFGPIVTLFVYEDNNFSELLKTVDQTSPYALTGAIFANDRRAINEALQVLQHSAGNFYINDKPTGAVVGQQPFGGARASGTNDKAGAPANLLRWVSARTIKENFRPPGDYRYPYMS